MQSISPDELKLAQVTPVYKKGDPLRKQYKTVSFVSSLAKLFEGEINQQLYLFFHDNLSPYWSDFRTGYNCDSLNMIRLVDNCERALYKGMV